jgi:hypothetical protein
MKRIVLVFVLISVFVWLFLAEHTPMISGRVITEDGVSVPGVQVTLFNMGTNKKITAITNENGKFVFHNPDAGPYFIRCQADGLKDVLCDNFSMKPRKSTDLKIVMEFSGSAAMLEL